jgi:diamine N-acetyltransferase
MISIANSDIKLRALEPDDVELLYRWENDPETWKVSNTRLPVSKYMLASYIKSCDRDFWESKELRLIIETTQGIPVGTVELFDFEPYHSRAGLGIMIFEVEERRKGIAFSAIQLFNQYAFNELGIYQLYANVAESNQASIQLFSKLGFEFVGVKKNWLRLPGNNGWENEYLFQKILV